MFQFQSVWAIFFLALLFESASASDDGVAGALENMVLVSMVLIAVLGVISVAFLLFLMYRVNDEDSQTQLWGSIGAVDQDDIFV
jgi:hypothetical protein